MSINFPTQTATTEFSRSFGENDFARDAAASRRSPAAAPYARHFSAWTYDYDGLRHWRRYWTRRAWVGCDIWIRGRFIKEEAQDDGSQEED